MEGLKRFAPEAGARIITQVTGQKITPEEYARRVKKLMRLGLLGRPIGNVEEWLKFGVPAQKE